MNVLVVGAGVFGSWSAWFLAARGHRVTLIDAYGPANPRASSADHSRVIRCGYGADAIYSRWAQAAFEDWRSLSVESNQPLLETSGAIFMGAAGNAYIEDSHITLTSLGIDCEWLSPAELTSRYPQIDATGLGQSLFEPGAGAIRAITAVQALVALMRSRALIDYRVAPLAPLAESSSSPVFGLANGESLAADACVCACGPWLASLFPEAIAERIRARLRW